MFSGDMKIEATEEAGRDFEAGLGRHSEAIGTEINTNRLSEAAIGKREFGFGVAIGNRQDHEETDRHPDEDSEAVSKKQ
jgi:hypothetical protein